MEYKIETRCLQFWVVAFSIGTTVAFYLIADYYMDPGVNNAFGGICNKRVEDACVYVNSHINPLYMWNYDTNIDCIMTLDAGSMGGAKFKVEWHHFNLIPGDCTGDHLKVYDTDMDYINSTTLIGTFCGGYIDLTGYPTQRYLTFQFHTDGSNNDKGFRLRATRYEPPPCQDDEFLCTSENICIDSRLKCDGTLQCADQTDENDCTTLEKFIGTFIALGMGGLVGVGIGVISGCVAIWTLVCVFTVCKKCCLKCCTKCCCWWPCCKGRRCCGNRPTSAKVTPGNEEFGGDMDDDFQKPAFTEDVEVMDEDNTEKIAMETVEEPKVDEKNTTVAGVGNTQPETGLADVQ